MRILASGHPPPLPGFLNSLAGPLDHFGYWAVLCSDAAATPSPPANRPRANPQVGGLPQATQLPLSKRPARLPKQGILTGTRSVQGTAAVQGPVNSAR